MITQPHKRASGLKQADVGARTLTPSMAIIAIIKGCLLCPWLPSPLCPGGLTHRIVAEELTVAAVTELPIAGVGGGRGARAALRAAILFLSQTLICLTGQATVCKSVPLAPRVPAAREKGPEVRLGGVGTEHSRSLEKYPHPSHHPAALHLTHQGLL